MAAVPRLDKKWDAVEVELRAKEAELSEGCVYFDRCSADSKHSGCCENRPPLVEVDTDHFVACGSFIS